MQIQLNCSASPAGLSEIGCENSLLAAHAFSKTFSDKKVTFRQAKI